MAKCNSDILWALEHATFREQSAKAISIEEKNLQHSVKRHKTQNRRAKNGIGQ
jgi:hypothetical protein